MEVVQDVLELTPSLYAEIVIKDQQRCYVKIGKVIVNSKIWLERKVFLSNLKKKS